MKSGINVEPPASDRARTDAWNAPTDRLAELSALLIFSPRRAHLLRIGNYIQTNPIGI